MFDFISKRLKEKFLTFDFMSRIIEKTVEQNLRDDYDCVIFDVMPVDIIDMHNEVCPLDDPDELTGFTMSNKQAADGGLHGCVFFSLSAIQRCSEDFGFLKSLRLVREITLHECRHADQFEFLRERGGPDLIERVTEAQKGVPYLENIFEVDAYYYQFTGEKIDFELVFARYLN
ncbi:MAG: hypothetical protein IJ668_06800 [Selenomonadaceae bacterium]|nr:hypothetical protein [Selenomonadaceae bacterium]